MAYYPQGLAQDAVCQSHTGHMTGLWFLRARPLRLNNNEWMNRKIKCNADGNEQPRKKMRNTRNMQVNMEKGNMLEIVIARTAPEIFCKGHFLETIASNHITKRHISECHNLKNSLPRDHKIVHSFEMLIFCNKSMIPDVTLCYCNAGQYYFSLSILTY